MTASAPNIWCSDHYHLRSYLLIRISEVTPEQWSVIWVKCRSTDRPADRQAETDGQAGTRSRAHVLFARKICQHINKKNDRNFTLSLICNTSLFMKCLNGTMQFWPTAEGMQQKLKTPTGEQQNLVYSKSSER